MEKIGVIVGTGKFPLYFIREAQKKGFELYPIGLFDEVDEEIKALERYRKFHIGQIGEIVKHFSFCSVKKLILLGKVDKAVIMKDLDLDYYGQEIMKMLPDQKDETLLFAVISFMKLNGIKVLSQNYLLSSFMAEAKCYTEAKPEKEDEEGIKLGMEAAKMLTRLDIGQSVAVKSSAVVALEGIEGTDKMLERAGSLAGEGCILVKMARPKQDMRVDIPTIGLKTVETAVKIGAKGIVIQAKKMFFLEQEEAIALAKEHGIFIVGRKG